MVVASDTNMDAAKPNSVRILHEDMLYTRQRSESSPSLRFYHTASSGAVPFLWESQPGTPKDADISTTLLPPLTPPPSYLYRPQSPSRSRRPPGLRITALLSRLLHKRAQSQETPPPSSPSSNFSSPIPKVPPQLNTAVTSLPFSLSPSFIESHIPNKNSPLLTPPQETPSWWICTNSEEAEEGKWRGMTEANGGGLQQGGVVGALALSVASSVAIVICNKALISTLDFPFATTLTSWHLIVTFCTLHLAKRCRLFDSKLVDVRTVVFFGLLNGTSIGLLNLTLGFNSIGFYQMAKLAIIPFTVFLETVFLKKRFSDKVKSSLVVLLVGVGIASVTDLKLNLLGSILAVLAVVTTCVGQIMTNTIQKQHGVSSTQLLYQSCPFQAAVLFVSGPFVDKCLSNRDVFSYNYTPVVMVFIVLSCLISVSVNFSTFLVIGKTSPVTYQVLGHLKTCLILTFGYTLLHDPFTTKNVVGIFVAVFGMGLYSYFSIQEGKKVSSDSRLPVKHLQVKEAAPLLDGKSAT